MKIFAAILLLGAFAYGQDSSEWGQGGGRVSTNCTCGYTNKGRRIVGGRPAQVNEYPLIAGLVNRGRPSFIFCGGTIITDRHVLTAAHCNPNPSRAIDVVLAEHNTASNTESRTTIINVQRTINHERYNQNGNTENDLAVLLLASRIPFQRTIGPACFPRANLNIVGSKVRVIGWGVLSSGGTKPNVLQKVDLDVKPLSDCARIYRGINNGQLCTYTPKRDSCQGDSGGPVIWLDPSTNRYTVVGIVSFGRGCAQIGAPGVNTAVSPYRNWILSKIGPDKSTNATFYEDDRPIMSLRRGTVTYLGIFPTISSNRL
ncbi:serine-type endopeptidase activity [Nesidiocoris tenuis]|uniref:Serine-type endopeptidase activity n=1 Tax=Nesidiocoris tenuis TaxID=355587 RepID=A0ABN7AWJ1_9HEMI|nr:serine-type endopeptidase activity [Nesidiocoris tenuis]